ncbi:MAG: DUF2341 domain-containing protein [Thermofilum sp.]|nr:DUF2341 domain-containing protein [Thermofilum sp.]
MNERIKIFVILVLLAAYPTYALPIAIKNKAAAPLENYVVFFTVERDRLAGEGIDPASMCAVDPAGSYLPLWVVPETLDRRSVAVYVRIPRLLPGDQLTIRLTPGSCEHNPKDVFVFFDDFKILNTSYWVPYASPNVTGVRIEARKGLLIQGTYVAPGQYVQVVSDPFSPFSPPLAVEALITPMTAYDHDACLEMREYGPDIFYHSSNARGAYIHAWGWGVSGTAEGESGKFAWYRLAGPATQYWDVISWDEGGESPVWKANNTFLFRIGASAEGVRYEVWQLTGDGLSKILGHCADGKLGFSNNTAVVLVLGQLCGGAFGFTQKAVFHWVLVRPFVWPEPKVAVGLERIEETPLTLLMEFLSNPRNQFLVAWGSVTAAVVLALVIKAVLRAAATVKARREREGS